ncbi:MAG TPA: RdgB/HAM1 family non-canonical purine NTP pyrophosphatase [Saprospiraceae bacterium]|nr:RdgB/HAM1 family non-canonical purine NTP pyrophosphatase [Saprospiraceae bacterium]HRW75317.1 RdgB/HAM1 family non-canonical purine NTP pyrophosphatase [Saprospiraceae bacterium]
MSNSALSLLFATNNQHKIIEVREILGDQWTITGLRESGLNTELPETGNTLEANAVEKATFIKDMGIRACFAEDSGLEVDALDGAPGVHTARYAGPKATAQENNRKLLDALQGIHNRTARFRAVIALWWQGELHTFEGSVEGHISEQTEGEQGFGYDPLFIPLGYEHTFAVLPGSVKASISHRAKAVQQLAEFLRAKA